MRFIMKARFPVDSGNDALRDPDFGKKMQAYLTAVKAEAAYFTSVDGQRGGYFVLDMADAAQIPAIAEPLFLWLNADVEFLPVMTPEDLGKAASSIADAVRTWG